MQTAIERSLALSDADPVAVMLEAYLTSHIEEERGHDKWFLQDYESLGFRRADLRRRMPSSTVAELVGAQYYWILHCHPVAFLGYLEMAEGYPTTAKQIEALLDATGFPKQAFRFLTRHAYLDLKHERELEETLDRMPLRLEQSALIGVSAPLSGAIRETVEQYTSERMT